MDLRLLAPWRSMETHGDRVRAPAGALFAPSVVLARVQAREQHVRVAELREVAHPHRVQLAHEVVALVLHDARMEALGFALDAPARFVDAGVPDAAPARHHGAQARDGEAAFPVLFLVV